MKRSKISATVIVYNEGQRIDACLKALKPAVDEIILVHDGLCMDNTLKIAKKYTKKIFVRPHWGEASPHKPFTIEKSTGSWIITVDADEIVTPKLQKRIRKLVNDADWSGINAYAFDWPFYDKGIRVTKGPLSGASKMILMRKSATACSGVTHDWYKVRGRIERVRLELDHMTEDNWSMRTFFSKNVPRAYYDALYRVAISWNSKVAIWYLIKAPIWGVIYFFYSFFYSKLFLNGRLGFRIAVQMSLYNFFLYYSVFRIKLIKYLNPERQLWPVIVNDYKKLNEFKLVKK
jgi:glycosyltransferase involved in cell wall biosynthesis